MTEQPSAEALLSVYRAALAYRDAMIVGMEVGQAHDMLLYAIEAAAPTNAAPQQAAQCPSCYWHSGHEPDEWFDEEAKIRGYIAPAGGRRDRPAATDPLEQARQSGFEQGIAAAAEYVEARPNELPAVLAGLLRDLGSMYAAEGPQPDVWTEEDIRAGQAKADELVKAFEQQDSALASTGEQPAPVWQPKVKKVAEGMFCNCGLSDIKDCKRGDKCKAEPVIYYDTMAAERPAPEGPQQQPSAAVVDYTERARELLSGCVGTTHFRAGDPDAGRRISDEKLVNRVAAALSAVASERDAAFRAAPSPSVADYTERAREIVRAVEFHLTRLDGADEYAESTKVVAAALAAVASERDAALEAGVSDTRARLQEPDVREAVAKAIYDIDPIGVRDWSNAPVSTREDCFACADAALTKIAEMLK